jgi:hypothetical protein
MSLKWITSLLKMGAFLHVFNLMGREMENSIEHPVSKVRIDTERHVLIGLSSSELLMKKLESKRNGGLIWLKLQGFEFKTTVH